MKHFLQNGYEVYSSISDNSEFDIIVSKDGILKKVEIKSVNYIRGSSYEVQLKSVRANKTSNKIRYFDSKRVDILAVFIEPENKVVIYDALEIKSKTTMRILVSVIS